jgi:hypothetical protein
MQLYDGQPPQPAYIRVTRRRSDPASFVPFSLHERSESNDEGKKTREAKTFPVDRGSFHIS